MIMLWNRKEVFVGNSLQKFNETRNILVSNRIKYSYRVVDTTGSESRGRTGHFGMNMDYLKTYYIYVHRKDYDKASALLGS
ncbi:MAG: hypothetical protein GX329_04805 [Tissierellia bacterium]|nr:hypothetical protein [Tissierellia bacterium]